MSARSPERGGKLEALDKKVSQLHLSQLRTSSEKQNDTLEGKLTSPRTAFQPASGEAAVPGGASFSGGQLQPVVTTPGNNKVSMVSMHPNSLLSGGGGGAGGQSAPRTKSSEVVQLGSAGGDRQGRPRRGSGGKEKDGIENSSNRSGGPLSGPLPSVENSSFSKSLNEISSPRELVKGPASIIGNPIEKESIGGGITLLTSDNSEASLPPIRSSSRSPQRPGP